MTVDDNLFDMMWNSIGINDATDTETTVESSKSKYDWRKQENGYYNSKPNDKDYFNKYYQGKTKQPCVCDICGSNISCKSNISKHKKTKKCQKFLIWFCYYIISMIIEL